MVIASFSSEGRRYFREKREASESKIYPGVEGVQVSQAHLNTFSALLPISVLKAPVSPNQYSDFTQATLQSSKD